MFYRIFFVLHGFKKNQNEIFIFATSGKYILIFLIYNTACK